ncbi:MAG: hypothetical protein LBI65_00305 [Candidatus Symbiothrix sp.]|jgi:hypothetical protein|nr:hypothetical protein [Candidatus Symbiothrix sp.]
MKIKIVFYFFFVIVFSIPMQAQVVIGSEKIPEKFSVLELISTTGGLRYPQLNSTQAGALKTALSAAANPLAGGLMFFHTDQAGNMEYYNGAQWSAVYMPFAVHSLRQPAGQGVEMIGSKNIQVPENASDVETQSYQLNFPATALSGISNLKVGKYLDFDNVIQSVTLDNASQITANNAFTVTFRRRAIHLIRESPEPFRFTLYATYDDNGTAKEIDLEVTLQRQ